MIVFAVLSLLSPPPLCLVWGWCLLLELSITQIIVLNLTLSICRLTSIIPSPRNITATVDNSDTHGIPYQIPSPALSVARAVLVCMYFECTCKHCSSSSLMLVYSPPQDLRVCRFPNCGTSERVPSPRLTSSTKPSCSSPLGPEPKRVRRRRLSQRTCNTKQLQPLISHSSPNSKPDPFVVLVRLGASIVRCMWKNLQTTRTTRHVVRLARKQYHHNTCTNQGFPYLSAERTATYILILPCRAERCRTKAASKLPPACVAFAVASW
ncbi:hypothetical protein J3F83DRAFT_349930 [Trichoderma novae-zelandiae]